VEQKQNNNNERKKAFKLLFIKTFKSITKGAATAEITQSIELKGRELLFNLRTSTKGRFRP